MKEQYIEVGDICWLHFNTKSGQSQYGDYCYQQAYAQNRIEKLKNDETYIKVRIKSIVWKYSYFCIFVETLSRIEGEFLYETEVKDVSRLILV